jgi:hypothetical protein
VMRIGRPPRCPRCGAHELIDILYGSPEDRALYRLWADGKAMIRAGRCEDGPPGWMCRECGYEYVDHRARLRRADRTVSASAP